MAARRAQPAEAGGHSRRRLAGRAIKPGQGICWKGDIQTQLTDSLKTSQVTEVDFSSCGIAGVALGHLSDWVRDATAAVEALAIGANPIGTEGGNILIEAIQSSNLKTIDIGKPLPLQGKYESDTADLADSGMGPGQVVILAWWLTTDAAAALTEVDVRGNKGLDKAAVNALRAVAPETCKILAD